MCLPSSLLSFSIGVLFLTAMLGVSSGWSQDKTVPTVPAASGKTIDKVPEKVDASKGAATEKKELVDINSASLDELTAIKGISKADSEKIVKNRPYALKDELVSKKVLSQGSYDNIKGEIFAKLAKDTMSKGTDAKGTVSSAADSNKTTK
jgi:DNA uptake protein ComE-like DNA-binding protein